MFLVSAVFAISVAQFLKVDLSEISHSRDHEDLSHKERKEHKEMECP